MQKELLIVVVLLLGGAFVAYNWLGTSPISLRSTRGVVSVEGASVPETKHDDKAVESKTPRHKADNPEKPKTATDRPTSNAGPGPVPVPLTISTTPATVSYPQPDPPFPTPETLRRGASAAEIRARFGKPTFDIAGTSDGRVHERYYYVNRDHSRLTLVDMENGLLTSSQSLSSPYFQLPGAKEPERSSVPR